MFQFPGSFPLRVPGLQPGGLPHSDTCGSPVVCTSPQLFAAYRVLRHRWEPRHPPCALLLLPSLSAPPTNLRGTSRRHPWRRPSLRFLLSFPVLSMNFLPGIPAAVPPHHRGGPHHCAHRGHAPRNLLPAPEPNRHRPGGPWPPRSWLSLSAQGPPFGKPAKKKSWRIRDSNP